MGKAGASVVGRPDGVCVHESQVGLGSTRLADVLNEIDRVGHAAGGNSSDWERV